MKGGPFCAPIGGPVCTPIDIVDVAVKFTNQRGEESVRATATIALPSKDRPLPLYPQVPDELAEKAVRMLARHRELGGD